MKKLLRKYFGSLWMPPVLFFILLVGMTVLIRIRVLLTQIVANVMFWMGFLVLLGLIGTTIHHFVKKRWAKGFICLFSVFGCIFATAIAFFILAILPVMIDHFGPSEDGFADNLTIPQDIEIAEPDADPTDAWNVSSEEETDELQQSVREALTVPGNNNTEIVPAMPSLRKASADYSTLFLEYIEASPDWHVFLEQGNRFAARRWSYDGEPRDELHGYISEFFGEGGRFQTRCLLCLDLKQWSRYSVQHVQEGTRLVKPDMSMGNDMHESRVMIECGGVWVEIFEQSENLERRITKATISILEKEFSEFLTDPEAAVANARQKSRELAELLVQDDQPFRLLDGMQPGIYQVVYTLNPGEPGSVYLKAFEVTKETPLSPSSLEAKSKTRITWSEDPSERFGTKAGFTIYEGDWGKPYAARFEVWFIPDSGEAERKLAERVFKIEGWQR